MPQLFVSDFPLRTQLSVPAFSTTVVPALSQSAVAALVVKFRPLSVSVLPLPLQPETPVISDVNVASLYILPFQ